MKADQLPGTRPDPGDWTLITVTYNSAEILTSAWSGVDLKGIRWIVVDNNSQDNSVQVARDLGADVISRSINAGFSPPTTWLSLRLRRRGSPS
ncbi:glycosyltransferase [Aeromicrobium sp. UC242_57]|uniref:glycosyltransferase n=1 Tax=Aeromicrobium sp. UC242_57 TaxID=3374624 RepID=UPI0037B47864